MRNKRGIELGKIYPRKDSNNSNKTFNKGYYYNLQQFLRSDDQSKTEREYVLLVLTRDIKNPGPMKCQPDFVAKAQETPQCLSILIPTRREGKWGIAVRRDNTQINCSVESKFLNRTHVCPMSRGAVAPHEVHVPS